jgi:hypothetical protein
MVKTGRVPVQSGRKPHSVTVHRTDAGRVASATWITSGSGEFIENLSSPPASPDPVTGAHQAARPEMVVSASNSAPGVAFTRIVR